MFNLIPKSLRASLKLCTVALMVACTGCTAIPTLVDITAKGFIAISAHPSSAPVVTNDIVYPQAPYVEPVVPTSGTETAKNTVPDPAKQP